MEGLMLIVDDSEVNREILRVLFQDHYEIMMAENGDEAVAILAGCQGNIDIVLLDLQMPGTDGFALMEHRKEMDFFKHVPVVIITGSSDTMDQIRAFELGASDYIQKPFMPEIVLSRINNVMAGTRRLESMEMEAKKLRIKSETDEMTGLLNKSTTEMLINERLKAGAGELDAMLVIDVDNFKTVNDTAGHQTGDRVLMVVANLISSRFRKTDYVGRVGGDEFCVLMIGVPSMKIVHEKVNELIQMMRYKPGFNIPDYVTLSIGLATNERQTTNYAELFAKADEALYRSKMNGRARYTEYGVIPTTVDEDARPAVLLVSDNRQVCSAVHALLPIAVRVIELPRVEELAELPPDKRENVALVYADVSDCEGNGADFWDTLTACTWVRIDRVLAICREGNVAQYREALRHDLLDVFTAPLEAGTFKRRTGHYLESLGLISTEE